MLDWRREGNVVRYFCSSCGKELAEKYDFDGGLIYMSCEHYEWEEVSATCYYNLIPGCGVKYTKWLKQNAVLRILNGDNAYLLIPKQI